MSVTREMIGAAHDILLKKEMVLSADLLASIYMAMSSRDAEVDTLRQQLASREAQIVMLRDVIEKIADNHGAYGPFPEANNPLWGPMAIIAAREALAATADLKDVRLCHAKPVETLKEAISLMNVDIDLYRAWAFGK
jgi:hypothetical protein